MQELEAKVWNCSHFYLVNIINNWKNRLNNVSCFTSLSYCYIIVIGNAHISFSFFSKRRNTEATPISLKMQSIRNFLLVCFYLMSFDFCVTENKIIPSLSAIYAPLLVHMQAWPKCCHTVCTLCDLRYSPNSMFLSILHVVLTVIFDTRILLIRNNSCDITITSLLDRTPNSLKQEFSFWNYLNS